MNWQIKAVVAAFIIVSLPYAFVTWEKLSPWNVWQRLGVGVGVFVVLSVVLFSPVLNAYADAHKPSEDMRVGFGFPDIWSYGGTLIRTRIRLVNDGAHPDVVEEMRLLQVQFFDRSTQAGQRTDICDKWKISGEAWSPLPPNVINKHIRFQSDLNNADVIAYDPSTYSMGASNVAPYPLVVEAGQTKELEVSFKADAAPMSNGNVLVYCPALKVIDHDGNEEYRVCRGTTRATVWSNHRWAGTVYGPTDTAAYRLLPDMSDRDSPYKCEAAN